MKKKKREKQSAQKKHTLSGNTVRAIVSGLLCFLVVLFLLAVILTLVTMYTDISTSTLHVLYLTALLIAALLGGFKTGRGCHRKGLLHGFAVGVLVCGFALVYTGVTADLSAYDAVIKSLIVMFGASTGGMIGVK